MLPPGFALELHITGPARGDYGREALVRVIPRATAVRLRRYLDGMGLSFVGASRKNDISHLQKRGGGFGLSAPQAKSSLLGGTVLELSHRLFSYRKVASAPALAVDPAEAPHSLRSAILAEANAA